MTIYFLPCCHRPAAHSAAPLQLTCRISVTSPGHSTEPTPSAVVDANIASRIKVGLLIWLLLGVAGRRLKPSPCSSTFIPLMTTMSIWQTTTVILPNGHAIGTVLHNYQFYSDYATERIKKTTYCIYTSCQLFPLIILLFEHSPNLPVVCIAPPLMPKLDRERSTLILVSLVFSLLSNILVMMGDSFDNTPVRHHLQIIFFISLLFSTPYWQVVCNCEESEEPILIAVKFTRIL